MSEMTAEQRAAKVADEFASVGKAFVYDWKARLELIDVIEKAITAAETAAARAQLERDMRADCMFCDRPDEYQPAVFEPDGRYWHYSKLGSRVKACGAEELLIRWALDHAAAPVLSVLCGRGVRP